MRIVQTVVAVGPPLLILWMGGTYLLDAGRLLLAPGVPVAFDYKSADGVVRLRAEGYRIDPDRRTAALWGLQARRPNGLLLASVRNVDVRGLDPFALRPDVRVRGAFARIERDKNGIDLARLFPKKEGPSSTIPYSVTVQGARLLYVDRTFARPISRTASTTYVAIDGVGDDWRAQGTVLLPQVGRADVRAQSLANLGVTLDVRSDSLRLEGLLPLVVPNLKARRLTAYGPVRIDIPKTGKIRAAATMRAQAEGIVYGRYAVDAVSLQGQLSEQGLVGAAAVRVGEAKARFEGSATRTAGGGRMVATVPSPRALPRWVRAYLPAKGDFRNASYEGWVSWSGSQPRLDGIARAARATYGSDSIETLRARVAYSGAGVAVRDLTASWNGSILAGDVAYEPRTRAIHGALLVPRVDVAALGRRLQGPEGLAGHLGGRALVSGTLARPNVEGRLAGNISLRGRALGDVEASGAWLDGAARIDRLKVSGPLGAIVAGGRIRPDGTLDVKAEARGLRVERLTPDARGLVSANLAVGGTLRDPRAKGRIEAYRLAYGDQALPAAGVDLTVDRRGVELTGLTAVRGTARLRGRMKASFVGPGVRLSDPRTWLVDGRLSLTGVQIGDVPGADAVGDLAGLLSIPQATVSGRLGDPRLAATLEGDGLIARGVRVESLRAEARADRRGVSVSNLEILAAGGRIAGEGGYAFASRSGDVDLQVAGVQLSRLLTDVSQDVVVDGTLAAPRIHLAIRNGKPVGEAAGTLNAVKVNGVLAGDGNWTLNADGEALKATASVGSLDPVLRVLDASADYRFASKRLEATLQAKDVPIQTVVAAAESQRESSEDEAERLSTVRGDLSGTVAVVREGDGTLRVDATDLRAAGLRYGDVDYGTLTATSIARRGGLWSVGGVALRGSAGNFEVGGTFEENGAIDLRATGDSVRLAAFSPFAADLAQITGNARFDLTGRGTIRRPIVVGTAGVDGLFAGNSSESLSVAIDRLSVQDGRSTVAGSLRYGSKFGGLVDASLDWAYREPIDGAPLRAKVDLGTLSATDGADPSKGLQVGPVALTDIPGLNAYVDKRGGGTLTGSLSASGTVAQPRLSGGFQLLAEKLGITVPGDPGRPVQRVDDVLHDVKLALGFEGRNTPVLTASARFDRGGTVAARATLGGATGEDALATLRNARDWKALPVAGSLKLDRATIRQTVAGGTESATIDGDLTIGGKAVAPAIKGGFVVSNLRAELPSLADGGSDSRPPLFDPSFDLTIALAQAGLFHTATADLYLTGDLSINGRLSNPRADAEFVTDRGSIRLPGGTVRVVKGGQISFAYRNPLAGGTPASANIDLQGRSQLTMARPGQGTQRYDISLDIRGDLLRENGIQFDASSDPPELNKDEILNALGGTQYLEGVTAGGNSAERNLRYAFAGFALPGLLDNLTNPLATAFGFDYVSLDYNQYDQATVAFGRALGEDFSFQGRGQVGSPTPGYRSIYDLRISFNPRRFLPKLSRFSLTVGTDQDRPWKGSIEYGTRFGSGGGAKPKPKHILFPAKPGTGWTPPAETP